MLRSSLDFARADAAPVERSLIALAPFDREDCLRITRYALANQASPSGGLPHFTQVPGAPLEAERNVADRRLRFGLDFRLALARCRTTAR